MGLCVCVYGHFSGESVYGFQTSENVFNPERITVYHGLPSVFVIWVQPISTVTLYMVETQQELWLRDFFSATP